MKKNNQAKLIIILFLVSLFTNFIYIKTNDSNSKHDLAIKERKINPKLNANHAPIYILGSNWTDAVSKGICTGDGSWANPFLIQDWIIDANSGEYGIKIKDSYNVYFKIENCSIFNAGGAASNYAGIKLDSVNNGTIIGCNISNNGYSGLYLTEADNNTIISNYLKDNLETAIYLYLDCNANSIVNNYIYGVDTLNSEGIYLYGLSPNVNTDNIIHNNTVIQYGSGIYLHKDCSNNTITSNKVEGASNSNSRGIFLFGTGDPKKNTNNIVKQNLVINHGYGMYISLCFANVIKNNTIKDLDSRAVYLYNCNNTLFENNIIEQATSGFAIRKSSFNNFSNNILKNFFRAVYINDLSTEDSIDNRFYGNYFRSNTNHVIGDNASSQIWNSSTIGNYWDDYAGVDLDDDGIGDDVYNISADGSVKDYLPIWNDGIDLQNGIIEINELATGIGANNWTWASERYWCTGSGTKQDPFMITGTITESLIIDANGQTSGIKISNSTKYFHIKNVTCINSSNTGAAVFLYNTSNGKITYNNLSSNKGGGIYLSAGSADNTIYENQIKDNGEFGISVVNSDENIIVSNILEDNVRSIREKSSSSNTIRINKINGVYTSLYIYDAGSLQGELTWNNASQFHWCKGQGTKENPYLIEDIIITGNNTGRVISIRSSSAYVELRNITAINSGTDASDAGIYLEATSNVKIINCNISNHQRYAIYLISSFFNNITQNKIENNYYGIYFYISDYNNITLNNISGNTHYGVYMRQLLFNCNNNSLFRNRFVGNDKHVFDSFGDNYWNSKEIGNYWDNYTELGASAVDDNDDGIGDIPYIQSNMIDSKPIYDDGFNGTAIHVDGSGVSSYDWSKAESLVWCRGSGTKADPYVIRDLKINARNLDSAIKIGNSSVYLEIINCTIFNSSVSTGGIYLYNTNNTKLRDNTISNNRGYGIHLYYYSSENIIENNIFSNNSDNCIYLNWFCENNTIKNNRISYTKGDGIRFYQWCDYNLVMMNNISNNTEPSKSGISFENYCDYNNITANTISNNSGSNWRGIYFEYQNDRNIISNNSFSNNNGTAIWFYRDNDYNNITSNSIINHTQEGILFTCISFGGEGNDYNRILNNFIFNCTGNSISIDGEVPFGRQFDNLIQYNIINKSMGYGIYMFIAWDAIIDNNNISNSGGIKVFTGSSNTIITNNILRNNSIGIQVSISTYDSLIYNNTFTGNIINAICETSDSKWNSTGYGNYWDDYDGWDIDGDGIGETPFDISGNGNCTDYFPLTDPTIIDLTIYFISPEPSRVFGKDAPYITLNILNPYLDKIWYHLEGSNVNYSFNYHNDMIHQSLWDEIIDNAYITFHFYYNDTLGNIYHNEIVIGKDTSSDQSTIGNGKDAEPQDLTLIYTIIAIVAVIAVLGLLLAKKSKSQLKEREREIADLRAQREEITEDDITISKEKHVCIVHKGLIEGYSYICLGCGTYYCTNCVEAIKKVENTCWSCGISLDPAKAKKELDEKQTEDKKKKLLKDKKETTLKDKKELIEAPEEEELKHKAPTKKIGDFEFETDEFEEDHKSKIPMQSIQKEKLTIKAEKIKTTSEEIKKPISKKPIQPQITQKETNIKKLEDYLKKIEEMANVLEQRFKSGEITQEDYIQKRTIIAEKMGEAIGKLEQLRQ
ncbi:MAG: NosD domain-containing protein [Promethearchaeota archaeon]